MSDSIEYLKSPQGSKEWLGDRAGVITASMAEEISKIAGGLDERQQIYVDEILAGRNEKDAMEIAGYKSKPRAEVVQRALDGEKVGDFTTPAHDYAFRLAVERISGVPLDEGFQTWAMARGHELEPAARAEHGLRIGQEIIPVGFARTKDGKFGASADGLISDDGGAEYKCFIAPDKLRPVILNGEIDQYLAQCQFGLWITGRRFWDFCLYCPALELADRDLLIFRMTRDEDYIERLEQTAIAFDGLVERYRKEILDSNHGILSIDLTVSA